VAAPVTEPARQPFRRAARRAARVLQQNVGKMALVFEPSSPLAAECTPTHGGQAETAARAPSAACWCIFWCVPLALLVLFGRPPALVNPIDSRLINGPRRAVDCGGPLSGL